MPHTLARILHSGPLRWPFLLPFVKKIPENVPLLSFSQKRMEAQNNQSTSLFILMVAEVFGFGSYRSV